MPDGGRNLDHAVIAVNDLCAAGELFRKLGFTTAPMGVHPFGTRNINVYLDNGFMIELLSVHEPNLYQEANGRHNTFTKNDQAFRVTNHVPGISHLVVTTSDALRDHARFENAGVTGGPLVEFKRDFVDSNATKSSISVRLAFATPSGNVAAYWFSCEDIDAPSFETRALLKHNNGVTGIQCAIGVADDPLHYVPFLENVCQAVALRCEDGAIKIPLLNGSYRLCYHSKFTHKFGIKDSGNSWQFAHVGLVLNVGDLKNTAAYFRSAGVRYYAKHGRLVVRPFDRDVPILIFQQELDAELNEYLSSTQ